MPLPLSNISGVTGWIGLGLLSLVFLANGLGVIDQRMAVQELARTGMSPPLARAAVLGGRILQLAAVPALFFAATRFIAAAALIAFLIPATLTAHAFWRAQPESRGVQLAGFCKNAAIIGGLLLAATWSARA